jgi:hypothetical protein
MPLDEPSPKSIEDYFSGKREGPAPLAGARMAPAPQAFSPDSRGKLVYEQTPEEMAP